MTPVLLLHGFPETSFSWRKQIPVLEANGFRAIAPDLRGYGTSPKPREVDAYAIPELVREVASLAVESGARQIVGHDWGGVIAWFLPMLHPSLVDRMVILNSPHPAAFGRELRRSVEQKLRASYQLLLQPPLLPELLMPLVLPLLMRTAGRFTRDEIAVYRRAWRDPDARRGMANYYRALRRHRGELRAALRPIEIPVLMIWGERDPVFVRATTEDFSEWVPNLRVERIADAGHFVQTDAPDRVNELLLGFLQR